MHRQVGLQGEGKGKEIGHLTLEQFQFDLADDHLAVAGDDLATIERQLDALALLRCDDPE